MVGAHCMLYKFIFYGSIRHASDMVCMFSAFCVSIAAVRSKVNRLQSIIRQQLSSPGPC